MPANLSHPLVENVLPKISSAIRGFSADTLRAEQPTIREGARRWLSLTGGPVEAPRFGLYWDAKRFAGGLMQRPWLRPFGSGAPGLHP